LLRIGGGGTAADCIKRRRPLEFQEFATHTHVTIYRPSPDRASSVIVSSKGIYGSHYFDSSVGVTAFVQSPPSNSPRSYLIYVNRSRADALRGLFGGWKRALIGGRLRDGAKKSMDATKLRLETEYGKD
jgi:hypothetical protein